jgi:hypothetical protein
MSDPDVKKDIFFWPFFTFHGYAIFARKSSLEKYCKNNDLNCISYVDLQRKGKDAVSGFFQASEIVVERFTDAEFALKDYTAKYQTNWDTLKIKDEPINEGKRKFKEFGFGDILCTNSLHVLDLENVADRFELMDKGDGMTRHKNFNGLICTMDFYRDHDELIKGLINSWFGCMKDTMQEWNIIKSASHLVDGDINYFIYQSLLNYLEEVTFSDKIPLEKFIKSFANNNEFFQDAHTAFERFMKMHNNTRDMERNWEIADIQNKGKVGRDRNEVIAKMLQNMNHVSKYILK